MPGKINIYDLSARGVVLDKSPIHNSDGELHFAQNVQVDAVGGLGAVRKRDGLRALNASPLAGPVLGGIGVPLPDRTLLQRVFYLPLNGTGPAFKRSTDGVIWTDVTLPSLAVAEATLGFDGTRAYGDASMIWRGVGDALYYPGNDFTASGPALPSIHVWDGEADATIVRIPPNPIVGSGTAGPFGVTTMLPWSPTQLLVAVADRNVTGGGGRMRVLLLDLFTGSLAALGPNTDLLAGPVIAGMIIWQARVWIAGVNPASGAALNTYWIRPGDPTWTLDNSYSTTRGYCTGFAVFQGDLYQGTAADAGVGAAIRKRSHTSAPVGSTSVLAGSTLVPGGSTVIQGGATPVQGGATAVQGGTTTVQAGAATTVTGGSATTVFGGSTTIAAGGSTSVAGGGATVVVGGATQIRGGSTFVPGGQAHVTGGSATVIERPIPTQAPTLTTYVANGSLHQWAGYYTAMKIAFSYADGHVSRPGPASAAVFGPTPNHPWNVGNVQTGGALVTGIVVYYNEGASASPDWSAPAGQSLPNQIIGTYATMANGATFTTSESLTSVRPLDTPAVYDIGATSVFVSDTSVFLAGGGGATVGGVTFLYTGRSTASGPGALTGVTGVTAPITPGAAIVSVVPVGATSIPVDELAGFAASGQAAGRVGGPGGATFLYTGRSASSGPGLLTGVTGLAAQIPTGSTVMVIVQVGATSLPVADTAAFALAAGWALVDGQVISYAGRSTASGPGALTGLSTGLNAITANIGYGATVAAYFPAGATSLPVYSTAPLLAPGAVVINGQVVTYTGLAGGALTGVAGIVAPLPDLSVVSSTVPIGGTTVPVADTAAFPLAAGVAGVAGQVLTYAGRTTTSGPGVLTGVTGITVAIGAGAVIVPAVPVGAATLPVADTGAFLVVPGTAFVSGLLVTYTGLSVASGPGTLTGVAGISAALLFGAPIAPVIPVGATSVPVADTSTLIAPGVAVISGQTVAYTGRSTTSGPGAITGVTGIASPLANGATVAAVIPAGATSVPVTDTAAFAAAAGGAIVGGQVLTYTGRSTSSGPGTLTGVTGVAVAIAIGSVIAPIVLVGAASVPIADTAAFAASAGGASVGGQLLLYTGRTTTSGPGTLTGVTGIVAVIPLGAPITPVIAIGATTLPVVDLAALPTTAGAAVVSGQTIAYTGRSGTSGPGTLTGVTGIVAVIPLGAAVSYLVPVGATSLPVVETSAFPTTTGTVLVSGQLLAYTGRSATSGPGTLTGVTGIAPALAAGAVVSWVIAIGATSLPIVDTAAFLASAGVAVVGAQTLTYTGRSTTSGPGSLTGVTGIASPIAGGDLARVSLPAGVAQLPVADTAAFLLSAGSAVVSGQAITYTGRSTTSGPGALTGVTGVSTLVVSGAVIAVAIPSGATVVPIADAAVFILAAGAALVSGMSITYTGRTVTSGPGALTGVAGVSSAIQPGATISVRLPIGSTSVPIADTAAFGTASTALVGLQTIAYTGRTTTGGPGALTGVTGVITAIAGGDIVRPIAPAGDWAVVYVSDGTAAGNYIGPLIASADDAAIFAFQNSVGGGAAPQNRIIQSIDGINWGLSYNVSAALGDAYGRSGTPIRDDNGDIYWPFASGAGHTAGGLIKRGAASGLWSIVLAGQTNIRGPLALTRMPAPVPTP